MYRTLIGSEIGTPVIFSVHVFKGRGQPLQTQATFVVSSTHIAALPTSAIASKMPFITSALITFMIPSFTWTSIGIVVNTQSLIQVVPANTAPFH
jgi:hypothetical protein